MHRSLFLSDFHLGALGCRPERILAFLEQNDAETIYLVGDILDTWHPLVPKWTDVHDQIIRLLLRRARTGTRVVYLPGNHDHALRAHYGTHLGCFEVTEQVLHRTADGRSFLVLHGDCADRRLFRAHVWTRIGSRMDGALRGLDARLQRWGRTLHPDDRSLIEVLLSWVKVLMNFGDGFEIRLTDMARALGQDGVICGHSHQAALHDDHGIVFANCGDWVDSFTAIAEDAQGRLSLLQAAEPQRQPAVGRPYPGLDAPGLAG
jgi:UDP-2,3-diacylglucosamine pyrophosphatase LpxH